MSGEASYDELAEICAHSDNPDQILESLDKLRALGASGQISLTQRLEAQLQALGNMRHLLESTQGTETVEKAILGHLLPDCLLLDEANSHLVSQHRDILNKWLNDLDDAARNAIRAKALERVLPLLETSPPQTACWVISSIGYRDARAMQSLWELVQKNDNEVGDTALSTITWLGVPWRERDVILQELHSRAARRYNQRLLWAMARLADVSSVPLILKRWLSPTARSEYRVDTSLVFTVLRELADANDDDHHLQHVIWTESRKLVEQDPKAMYWRFDVGHVAVACDDPDVIPTLMSWHGQHSDWFENPRWARYLAQERLERCVKPRQIEGWTQIRNQAIFEFLRQDACLDTGMDGFSTTQEGMVKESAWKTLLRAGYEDALNWFDVAVVGEQGRFTRQKVMEYLACFRIDPLPDVAVKWITEAYDHPGNSDGREIFLRMAAVRMARSTATEAALEHLLSFGFTYRGQVITESSDAVAEVALHLVRHGNIAALGRLSRMLIQSPSSRQRYVCANALEVIASFPEHRSVVLPYAEVFVSLIYDESRDEIERGLLLNTLGHLVEWVIPKRLWENLVLWAEQPDRWIGGGSLQVLASHGHLEQHPKLMSEILGLEQDGEYWRLGSGKMRFEWAPYIIGLLYQKSPQAYTPAIVSLLANPDWRLTVQAIRWLDAAHGKHGQPEVSRTIVDALIRRTHEHYSPSYGETEVFDVLSRLAPHALIGQNWGRVVATWIPDTRVALANALGKAKAHPANQGQCLAALEMLAEDSLYPVRRAAYRGLAKQSATHLYKLCQSWLTSPLLRLGLRAAEACGWLENVKTENGQDGFEELYQQCASHPESSIREAAHRSREERRQRLWSGGYLAKIMSVEGKDNLEVLRTWCYGEALSQIGDDECREMLREHVSGKPLPPNIRYWIEYIIEELEKNWKKATHKWPDPWTDMSGAIERGDGKLILGSEKVVDVQYSVWRVPAASPEEKHAWGGTMIAPFEHFFKLDAAIIELEGGRRGKILLAGFMGDTATFLGTESYPQSG